MRGILIFLLTVSATLAAPKKVAVFVALCDNATQGIIPVPAKIGDGNKPDDNLYWGCTDGFAGCFRASKIWKLQRKEVPQDKRIFERLVYLNESVNIELTAEAWRGSEIKACLKAFELALVSGNHELCAYIGHNVLMDGDVPPPVAKAVKPCDAIVLCCVSEGYFKNRLAAMGARPVLLTSQLMYPGSFCCATACPCGQKNALSPKSGKPPARLMPSIRRFPRKRRRAYSQCSLTNRSGWTASARPDGRCG